MKARAQIHFPTVCLLSCAFVLLKGNIANGQPILLQLSQQTRSTEEQLDEVIDRQKKMERDIQEIKTILQRLTGQASPPAGEFRLNLDGVPFKGNQDAKIILIEFSDYQCPFCSRHFHETLPRIENEYLKPGKLKYVFWDFPLESLHREAFKAHAAAHCSGEQGKYWEMHDRLFQNQDLLAAAELPKHAQAVGLELPRFQNCLDTGKYTARIREAIAEGQKIGIAGTPTFFLVDQNAPPNPSRKILALIRGAQPYAQFRDSIEEALADVKDEPR